MRDIIKSRLLSIIGLIAMSNKYSLPLKSFQSKNTKNRQIAILKTPLLKINL